VLTIHLPVIPAAGQVWKRIVGAIEAGVILTIHLPVDLAVDSVIDLFVNLTIQLAIDAARWVLWHCWKSRRWRDREISVRCALPILDSRNLWSVSMP
jgi:hypothetical protein